MSNKTEQATAALLAADEVKSRGHAFMILKARGLTGSGRVFNGAVKAYEAERGIELGKSQSAQRTSDDATNRATAHQMSADDVTDHINNIEKADSLFWACWKVFRHEGKWETKLSVADFATHFQARA